MEWNERFASPDFHHDQYHHNHHHNTAPDANPSQVTITDIKLNGFESIRVDMTIAMDIVNTNKQIGIGFDSVNVTYSFPASPDLVVGRGTLEGGEIPAGGHVQRPLSSTFTAPWSVLGTFVQ
jgi:hypothetical protein